MRMKFDTSSRDDKWAWKQHEVDERPTKNSHELSDE